MASSWADFFSILASEAISRYNLGQVQPTLGAEVEFVPEFSESVYDVDPADLVTLVELAVLALF